MRDFRSGWRHEMVEHRRGDVLLFRPQPTESALEMRADDRARSAELLERRQAQNGRSALALDLPEPLQHKLQVGRLDPALVHLHTTAAAVPHVDLARGDLVEHRLDQLGLDANLLAGELVVALERPDDRLARAAPVEVIEPEVVREEVWYPPFEGVELGERILTQAEEEVRAEARFADRVRELVGEGATLVVEEVLLKLVQDHVDVAANRPRRSRQALDHQAHPPDRSGQCDT